MKNFENTINQLKECGFKGFVTVKELKSGRKADNVPSVSGIYIVLRPTTECPEFIYPGTGGFFKDKDPNVSLDELRSNWVEEEPIIYIGQSNTNIKRRLKEYMNFGCGKKVGHKGGRYIWQLADSDNLIVCWKEVENARAIEKKMIADFKDKHNGMRPFANLID